MTVRRRWLVVALVAVLIVVVPIAVDHRPASASDVSATTLRSRVLASSKVPFSADVTSTGSLQLPDSSTFAGVGDLLGGTTTLRVWWRDGEHWRVDDVSAGGEKDLYRNGSQSASWSFESETVTYTPVSTVRLPDTSDVVPSTLARRLLEGSTASELTRLPSKRVDGRSAPGLRLTPSDAASTISHVDVWADETSGVALEVEVFTRGDAHPVLTTKAGHLHLDTPSAATTTFTAPRGVKRRFEQAADVAAASNAFAPFLAPDELAGFGKRSDASDVRAVGVYGRGPTSFLAVPLRRSIAASLRSALLKSATSTSVGDAIVQHDGPLTVLVTRSRRGGFLLAGTVDAATLEKAAATLETIPFVNRRPSQ